MFVSHHLTREPARTSTSATPGLEPFDRVLARVLDRQADHALHLGYHLQAERLAERAAELRGVVE